MVEQAAPVAPTPSAPAATPAVSQTPAADTTPPSITKESIGAQGTPGTNTNATPLTKADEIKADSGGTPTVDTKPPRERLPNGQYKNGGFEQVDFNDLPPELRDKFEPRFKRLYRQIKAQDSNFQALTAHNQAMEAKILELTREHTLNNARGQYATLEQQAAEASRRGDWQAANRLQRDMLALEQQDYTPQPIAYQQPSVLSPDEVTQINQWSAERPWAQANHPMFNFARDLGVKLFKEWGDRDTPEVLGEIDRIMSAVTNQSTQQATAAPAPVAARPAAVLGTNQNSRPATPAAVGLSPEERYVAERVFRNIRDNAGQPLSKAQMHERYQNQKKLLAR